MARVSKYCKIGDTFICKEGFLYIVRGFDMRGFYTHIKYTHKAPWQDKGDLHTENLLHFEQSIKDKRIVKGCAKVAKVLYASR